MNRRKGKKEATTPVAPLSEQEAALILAVRRIPAGHGERYRRATAIIEYLGALAEGMKAANV